MLTLAVEGISDEAILRRLCLLVGVPVGPVHGLSGKLQLDRNIFGYNAAAQYAPWLVVRDLNGDADCAPSLRAKLLPNPSQQMYFRISVRAIEAWLLADREGIRQFLGISKALIPRDPEQAIRPKRTLVNLARRSRKRAIFADMVPAEGTSALVGPGYTARIIEFANNHWDPEAASVHADSLARCIKALREIQERFYII